MPPGPSTSPHLPTATAANQKSASGGPSTSELPPVAGVPSALAMTICDTGEMLPAKLVQGLRDFTFIELHWFLPASLLQTALRATEEKTTDCHCCHTPETKRKLRTVSDIFTWLACFHRYTAALGKLYPGMVPHMMAYANVITQASLQFAGDGWRVYDRAFRIQAAARHITDWSNVDPGLYARHVTGQTHRATICHFCSSSTHGSATCPWGVDEPSTPELPRWAGRPSPAASTHPYGNPVPICTSWNAGPCRFRDSCRFRHVCSSCFRQGHRAIECRWGGGHRVQRPPSGSTTPQ